MNHHNESLSALSAVAVALGLAACAGGSRQSQANAPMQPQPAPMSTEYGAAMGQPAGAAPGQPAAEEMPPPSPSPTTGPSGSQPGETSGMQQAPGSTAGMGSPSGMPGGIGTPGMTGGTSGMGSPEVGGGPMNMSGLDDAQIAAVVQAVNIGQMQAAQLAETKATSPEVKRFARQMATDHQQMETASIAVFSRMQVTPSDSAVSTQLKSDSQGELSNLHGMHGKDFDREYIDSQVRDHNRALELVDRMMQNAKNPELKADLEKMRPKIEAHMRHAERLQQMLQGMPKGTPSKQRERGGAGNPSPSWGSRGLGRPSGALLQRIAASPPAGGISSVRAEARRRPVGRHPRG